MHVLEPGYFHSIEKDNNRSFTKTLLINNVKNSSFVKKLAEEAIERGEINRYIFIKQQLPYALKVTGLSISDLGRAYYYSVGPLVASTLPGDDWFLYWDAEVTLSRPCNWVDRAIKLMDSDPRIIVANPNWSTKGIEREMMFTSEDGKFAISYGVSDQCFLARRSDLARPIWNYKCPASLRYPLAHIAPVFEQRLDSYTRQCRKLRATYLGVSYNHINEGQSYPETTLLEKMRYLRNTAILSIIKLLPTSNPCWKINPKNKY